MPPSRRAHRRLPKRVAVALVLFLGGCAALAVGLPGSATDDLRIGIVTDIHAHDIDSPLEDKWMTHTAERLRTFTDAMNAWPAELVIELGDFVNGWVVLGAHPGEPDRIPDILSWADGLLAEFDGPRYHVIGNHDVYNLSKEQYLDRLGMEATAFSFDAGMYHVVVLDLQYDEQGADLTHTYTGVQGWVPSDEIAWLRADLATTARPTIVCVHQMLDVDVSRFQGYPLVGNCLEVRRLLAESGVVIAVFQGHEHDSRYTQIDGIHYVTFEALVDQGTPASWAYVTLDPASQTITIAGAGEQEDYSLKYEAPRREE